MSFADKRTAADIAVPVRMSTPPIHKTITNPADIDDLADAISGLTHPSNFLTAVVPLWKRRGALTAAMRSNWVERLFVLTETALFWYEPGGMLVAQHGRIELRHIKHIKPAQATGGPSVTHEELERFGPKFQLEVTLSSDFVLHIGGTDDGFVEAWREALSATVDRAAQALANPTASPPPPPPLPSSLLRMELTGIVAVGMLGKARQALTGSLKSSLEHANIITHRDKHNKTRDGWSNRCVVLTENMLYFYKPTSKRAEDDDAPAFGGFGSTLRSGDYIFGREVGRMPLGMADVNLEQVSGSGRV